MEITPHENDPDPSPILGNLTDTLHHRARVERPMVRRGWLSNGPGPSSLRGEDAFVAVPWDEVLDRLAQELTRVRDQFGPQAVFGGSYGWSSAGRFHHVQSQIHRFLNVSIGGYVRSVGSYSAGAAQMLLPHIIGKMEDTSRYNVSWDQIIEHTDTVLAFGGMALKNTNIAAGGVSHHIERNAMSKAAENGVHFINISPMRSDFPAGAKADWIAPNPGTDTALILAMIHTLDAQGLADRAFLEKYCVGVDQFLAYIRGESDGTPKTPAWAATIADIPAHKIVALAQRVAKGRTLVTIAHALQRAEHGEQPIWAALALAAVLGQIGLPGGGFNYALGAMGHTGRVPIDVPSPTLSQGKNGVADFIPCARISDMLLNPGEAFQFYI